MTAAAANPHTPPPAEPRRCWAKIDLGALRHNLRAVHECTDGDANAGVMAVVKANAYGHGMSEVARALRDCVQMFGVANLAEARALRDALEDGAKDAQGSAPGIFILGPALPHEREEIARANFVPAVSSIEEAAAYAAFAASRGGGRSVRVHLAIDTGMGRIGIWQEEALAAAVEISRIPGVEISGLATHLPVADEDETFTAAQLAGFERLLAELAAAGIRAPVVHSLNSAGVMRFPKSAGSLVRAGLMLYGSAPVPGFQPKLRPVMTWKTRVTLVRDVGAGRGVSYGRTFITPRAMRIATLAAGYADGYQRSLSNRGAEVLIRGRRCPVLGRVTMDQIMADVSHLPGVEAGEEAVLMGRQGDGEISAAELAEKAGTIAWEIFTGIGPRVERTHFGI